LPNSAAPVLVNVWAIIFLTLVFILHRGIRLSVPSVCPLFFGLDFRNLLLPPIVKDLKDDAKEGFL
jgi:hypothetical protein